MTNPDEIKANATTQLDLAVAELLEEFPKFRETLYRKPFSAPVVTLQCASGHPLIHVTMDLRAMPESCV